MRAAIGMRLPEVSTLDPRTSPFETQISNGLSMKGAQRFAWRTDPIAVVRSFELNARSLTIFARETLHNLPFRLPYVASVDNYKKERLAFERRWQWAKNAAEAVYLQDASKRAGPGGLNIDIPVPIKSKAFQSIFGGSTVGLNVQGDINIKGGFRNEDRSDVRTTNIRGASTSFKMNQTQRFTVTGRIGEKVTVNVDQDSERAFEFDNNLKLNYTGFDDEIIQSIEAGNIALTLPGTRFVTFSGKSSGLFGIKANMQLGNLALTTIASQEKGENKKLSLSGGQTEDSRRINDYEYLPFTYFFIDSTYRENFKNYSNKWTHQASPRTIDDIKVFKSVPSNQADAISGVAVNEPNQPEPDGPEQERFPSSWKLLNPQIDYYVEKTLGYLVLPSRLNSEEVLAIAYRKTNPDEVIGTLDYQIGDSLRLKLIKPRNPLPSHRSWKLAWKNVYSLGSKNIDREGFQLKIYFKTPSGDPQESDVVDGQSRSFLNIFGLDEVDANGAINPDNNLDNNAAIVNWARGELIFPWLEPFDPDRRDRVFINGTQEASRLGDAFRDSTMYTTNLSNTSLIAQRSKFFLDIKSKERSANYSLGFNVIENSEKVLLDGRELRRDVDYVIDYFSGSLTILNPDATRPTAQVDITYQSNQLFQLEKKTILGTRADYRLGRDSFVGGTVLYLNERTLDQRVRIGQGPVRNLIWDLNTSLRFSPGFLTKAVNALPFIRTAEPSSIAFEGEIAQIIPNPNTLNNPGTGDNDGVAYIDDFEAAKRTTPLGVLRKGWVESSIPTRISQDLTDPDSVAAALSKKGTLYWFNPFNQTPIRQIKPNQDVNSNVSQTTQILVMDFKPKAGAQQSWGGIMRALSAGFFDQSETKFIEIWINGDTGRVHIDIGSISEDIIPNGILNTEDKESQNGFRNGILDDDEDVGLDGIAGADTSDFWDLNRSNARVNPPVKNPGEPPSNDDWLYREGSNDYSRINRTEGNRQDTGDTGTIRPDTEDINGNGNLDEVNNYFEYVFDLDINSPDTAYIRGGTGLKPEEDFGWRLYRIPIGDVRFKAGQPDLAQIEHVRLWVDGVAQSTRIGIAEINFVGNEWREAGTTDNFSVDAPFQIPTDTSKASLSVAVVNTHDNPEYTPPKGVGGERDRVTQVLSKEQSLVLRARKMQPGNAGIVQKSFVAPLNFINYRRLRMFVHAQDDPNGVIASDTSIVFFLRFGADDKNYYEFRERVFPLLWDERNEMDIDVLELARIKDDSVSSKNYDDLRGAVLKVEGTQEWRIRGKPSLTNVRLLAAGVVNASSNKTFNGEIWMDEFRASDVKKDKGMAMRARADIKLADFIQLSGEVERRDAEFHNVAERISTNPTSSFSTRINANVALDRMLPQSFGLSLPVSVTYANSNSLPKYIPGKDVETATLSGAKLDEVRSINEQRGFTISARRRVTSKNWLVRYTLDNLSANLSNTENHAANSTTRFADRSAWAGNLNYALAFGRNNFVSPFWFMKSLPLLGKIGGTKLYFTPQNFDAKFQNNVSISKSETRVTAGTGLSTNVKTDIFSRDFHLNYKLLEPLTLDWSRGYTHDLSKEKNKLAELLTVSPGKETGVSQSFSGKYSPTLFAWLNNSVNYSTTYRYVNNIEQQNTNIGRQATNNTNLSLSATLRLSQLIKSPSSSQGRRGRSTPAQEQQKAPARVPEDENENNEPEDEENPQGQQPPEQQQEQPEQRKDQPAKTPPETPPSRRPRTESKPADAGEGGNPILNSLSTVLGKFRDISLNYTQRNSVSNFGLEDGQPSWRYQFGLDRDPGVKPVAGLATNPKTLTQGDNYAVQTGLAITQGIGVDMRFSYDQLRNESTTTNGNTSISGLGKGTPFPELTLNISGLEKIPFFRKVANTVSFSSNFTPQFKTVWVKNPSNNTTNNTGEDETKSFRPLAKINVNWKNSMITSVQYNSIEGLKATFDPRTGQPYGKTKTYSRDLSITHTYSKRSGFRIPIWFLKNKELKNSIDLSISFTSRKNGTQAARGAFTDFEDVDNSSSWSFEPKMTYSFSTRVRGGAHFTIGKNKSLRAGETKIKELGIDVNISIRGN